MLSAGAEKRSEVQEGTAEESAHLAEAPSGSAQSTECPVTVNQCLVLTHEACGIQGDDKCPTGPVSDPELQEEQLKLKEERLKSEVEALEERGPKPMAPIVRSSHGPKRKPVNFPGPSHQAHSRAEAELPQELPLQREDPEASQNEPSQSAKQHKKAKKRKSLGAPELPPVASIVSAPSENLGLERKTQRLRPLYQYINYCNPELNQAGEGDRETEAEVEPEWELNLVPEEAGVEQLSALLPVADLGSPNKMPEEEEAGKMGGGFSSAGFEVDWSFGSLRPQLDQSLYRVATGDRAISAFFPGRGLWEEAASAGQFGNPNILLLPGPSVCPSDTLYTGNFKLNE